MPSIKKTFRVTVECAVVWLLAAWVLNSLGYRGWVVDVVGLVCMSIVAGFVIAKTTFGNWVYLSFLCRTLLPWNGEDDRIIAWRWSQRAVDELLTSRADAFLRACFDERLVKDKYNPEQTLHSTRPGDMIWRYRIEFWLAHRRVLNTKKKFWTPRNAATEFGFSTHRHAKDYTYANENLRSVTEL